MISRGRCRPSGLRQFIPALRIRCRVVAGSEDAGVSEDCDQTEVETDALIGMNRFRLPRDALGGCLPFMNGRFGLADGRSGEVVWHAPSVLHVEIAARPGTRGPGPGHSGYALQDAAMAGHVTACLMASMISRPYTANLGPDMLLTPSRI